MSEHETDVPAIDTKVQRVAELLPFPVELDADMGGTFALQIDLGVRGLSRSPNRSRARSAVWFAPRRR